jgi:hypothetical protein|nr:MAG TPA: putative periplasmic lipoprotein [Crassvirales sp.]
MKQSLTDRIALWCVKNIGVDGCLHFITIALLTKIVSLLGGIWVAIVISAATSVAKEVWDAKRGGYFDKKDLACDALGILFALLMSL